MKTSIKIGLISSSLIGIALLTAPVIAKADQTNGQDLTNVQVNQKHPQKNQKEVKKKNFLNKPGNNLQNDQNNNNQSSNTSSLTNYAVNNVFNDYGYSHFTRYNLENMQNGITSVAKNPIANFNGIKISDVLSAKDTRNGFLGEQMNVWDSWPLQDAKGNEVTYHGYHIVFALAGNPQADYKASDGTYIQDTHIYVFYQKVGEENNGIKSWKNAGQLFNTSTEGSDGNDDALNHEVAQWSGETVQMKDGQIRLFYTSFPGSYDHGRQVMATAKISLKSSKNGISVDHDKTSDHHTILKPDGQIYQDLDQALSDNYDENAFRDAHYFEYDGHKYLIFEANSGPESGYQGDDALFNSAYLGGDTNFQNQQQNLIVPTTNSNGDINPWHKPAVDYNAVIGMVELNNDYSVKKIMNPILGLNTVTDEFERPNLVEHNGKWYLFGITRGYKLATPNVKSTNSFMLGFVADSPFGPYRPLNGNGLVIRNTRAWSSRYYDYSFYVLNNNSKKSNEFVVTSYMTNTKQVVGHQTFAPSFMLKLDGDKATILKNKVLPQNATTTKNTNFIQKQDHVKNHKDSK